MTAMDTRKLFDRYDRQIRLFGVDVQEKIAESKVFIAGAGGLGSPISLYLAAAGVGKIVIADNDEVELSNLNRQILHWERDLGRKKALSAREKLTEMNSDIVIVSTSEKIEDGNVSRLVGDADIIIDAMDNFPTRYMLNKTALEKDIPFIHGAVHGFHGQATTVIPWDSACLRCIFPQPPPPATFPVVGVTSGIIGLIQATEAIKYLTGMGDLLSGRLLIWDGLKPSLETIEVMRDPLCRDCGGLG